MSAAPQPDAAAVPDPWVEQRARHPGAMLVRVIHTDRDLQYFLQLHPAPERREAASLYDGATVLTPSPEGHGYTQAEHDLVVAEADAAWAAKRAERA